MDIKLYILIISAVLAIIWAIIWGIAFYFFKKNDKKKDDCIAELFKSRNNQKSEIQECKADYKELKSKLWEESKLEKLIKAAIKSEFQDWEISLLKEGVLKPGS